MTAPASAALIAALLLGGCTLAPDYHRPALPVPASLPADGLPSAGAASLPADELGWQDFFLDERLRAVVGQAITNNRDLRIAVANVEQARALYRVERSALLPAVGAGAGANLQRLPSQQARATGQRRSQELWSAEIGTSWEIDLFGRTRSLSRAALEQYFATEEAQRAARISLIGETATAWLTLAADRERLAIAEQTLASFGRTLELVQRRFDRGLTSAIDLRQAQTIYAQARSDIAQLKTIVEMDRNALVLLVGAPVPDHLLPRRLDETSPALSELPANVDSAVLLRRPDVLAAEHRLIAANADIGAARAAFFPSISLTGALGTISGSLSGLLGDGTGSWSFSPAVSLPIFAGGRNRAGLRYSEASRDVAVAEYEKAVQIAFREAADALARRATIDEQLDAQRSLVEAASQGYRLSEDRYKRGADTFLTTLDAQRTLFAAQQSMIDARLAQATNLAALYRVFGGGAL